MSLESQLDLQRTLRIKERTIELVEKLGYARIADQVRSGERTAADAVIEVLELARKSLGALQ
jgi:hypothetical protein